MAHTAHSGHHGNGGIQKHSTGTYYPWNVMQEGDTCRGFNGSTGEYLEAHPFINGNSNSFGFAYDEAEADIVTRIEQELVAAHTVL